MSPISNENPTTWDKLGIWISSLCALHCLLLPLMLPVAPLLASSFFAQEWFEHIILVLSMLVGAFALLNGAMRYHGQLYPLVSLFVGGIIYWQKGALGEAIEPYAVGIGALLIILGHWQNMRLCHQCKCCADTMARPHPSKSL